MSDLSQTDGRTHGVDPQGQALAVFDLPGLECQANVGQWCGGTVAKGPVADQECPLLGASAAFEIADASPCVVEHGSIRFHFRHRIAHPCEGSTPSPSLVACVLRRRSPGQQDGGETECSACGTPFTTLAAAKNAPWRRQVAGEFAQARQALQAPMGPQDAADVDVSSLVSLEGVPELTFNSVVLRPIRWCHGGWISARKAEPGPSPPSELRRVPEGRQSDCECAARS